VSTDTPVFVSSQYVLSFNLKAYVVLLNKNKSISGGYPTGKPKPFVAINEMKGPKGGVAKHWLCED
jgi:hypothetical protein